MIKVQEINLISPKENINYNLYKRTYKGNVSHVFKMFKEENGITTIYYNENISKQTYLNLISKYKVKDIIFYNQLSLIENRQLLEFKFYDDYSILEYEENKLNNELILPNNVKINNNKELLKRKKHDNIN